MKKILLTVLFLSSTALFAQTKTNRVCTAQERVEFSKFLESYMPKMEEDGFTELCAEMDKIIKDKVSLQKLCTDAFTFCEDKTLSELRLITVGIYGVNMERKDNDCHHAFPEAFPKEVFPEEISPTPKE